LIGQALADSLPLIRRQRLHLRAADAMAGFVSSDRSYVSEIAHHLYRAGPVADSRRTAHALVAAGDAAHAIYATQDAIRHYRRALELLGAVSGAEDLRLMAQEKLADLLMLVGECSEAKTHYQSLGDAYQATAACVAQARLARKMGTLQWQTGDRAQAMECYERALASLEGANAAIESAHLYQEFGLAAFRRGDNQQAIEWAERALRSAETALADSPAVTPDVRRTATAAVAHATNTIGVAMARSGQLEAAREHIEQSVAAAREHGLLDVACRGYANLGVLYSTVEPKRAIDVSLVGLDLAAKIGAASLQSYIYANLAAAYCALTERCEDEGLLAAKTAANLDRELGQLDHLAVPLIVIAQIHQCNGELQQAQDLYREALELAEKAGEPQLLMPCYDGLATVYLDRGDRALAEQYMEKARELSARTGIDPDAVLLLPFLC
jgi:adenylate cyclase